MTKLHYQSAGALAGMIREKKIGALELLEHFMTRVERFNPKLNAIIWQDLEGARSRAREADARLAKGGTVGPLHGLPMTVKESFNLTGSPTTFGKPEMKDSIAGKDAVVIERLKSAGANIFGKTNVPLLLADWQSFNAIYGTTNNPWDVTRTPGGSSGGASAALAAGLTGLEAGSDIGASIRNPAHYCGLFGHKPSYGLVPYRGHALPGVVGPIDLTVAGPLARSASDLELELGVIAGPDILDAPSYRLELKAPRGAKLSDYRAAVLLEDPNCAVDSELQDRLAATIDALAKAGLKIVTKPLPVDTREAHRVYITLLRAATSARLPEAEIERWRKRAAELDQDDDSYLARVARASTISHRDWLAANERRHQMRYLWAEYFRDVDLLLCPTAASAAWPHDQKGERIDRTITVNGRQENTNDQLFWAGLASMPFLPGTVAPAGLTRSGLPCGMQIIAPFLEDLSGIHFAKLMERELGGFVPPPGYD